MGTRVTCREWSLGQDALTRVFLRNGFCDMVSLAMLFTKRLRDGVRLGKIRCSVRIWKRPRVKVGGRYRMDDGCIVVDSLHEYVGNTNLLLTYPTVRESTPWRGKLKIQPFEQFLAAVVGSR